jgi:hypothetical protein
MKTHPIKSDSRYTVQREFCGHAKPRFVARFCGEFISSHLSYSGAVLAVVGHKAVRDGALVFEEVRP